MPFVKERRSNPYLGSLDHNFVYVVYVCVMFMTDLTLYILFCLEQVKIFLHIHMFQGAIKASLVRCVIFMLLSIPQHISLCCC